MKKANLPLRKLCLRRDSLLRLSAPAEAAEPAQLIAAGGGFFLLGKSLVHCPYTQVGLHGCRTHVPHCGAH